MVRDLGKRPLLEVTLACADGRVRLNGAPYSWEADDMVHRFDDVAAKDPAVGEEAARVRFTLDEPAQASA